MGTKRCKLSKAEYKKKERPDDPFRCAKCGRTARKPKRLCKPKSR